MSGNPRRPGVCNQQGQSEQRASGGFLSLRVQIIRHNKRCKGYNKENITGKKGFGLAITLFRLRMYSCWMKSNYKILLVCSLHFGIKVQSVLCFFCSKLPILIIMWQPVTLPCFHSLYGTTQRSPFE